MAQTKRKRRSKHRGTPAGTIEARGRTGRRPTAAEVKKQSREDERRARMLKEPTLKGSLVRAAFAAALLFVFTQTLADAPLSEGVMVSVFAMLLYVPLGYYTDRFMWKRRVAREAARGKGGGGK